MSDDIVVIAVTLPRGLLSQLDADAGPGERSAWLTDAIRAKLTDPTRRAGQALVPPGGAVPGLSTAELIERTSLGTPEARRHRRNTPPEVLAEILAKLAAEEMP